MEEIILDDLRFEPFDSLINLNSIRPSINDELFCYNKNNAISQGSLNHDFLREDSDHIDDILAKIEVYNPICLSLLYAFNIPTPIADVIAKSFIKSTLEYYKKEM